MAAIAAALRPYADRMRRVGHEAGSLSPWLHTELLAEEAAPHAGKDQR